MSVCVSASPFFLLYAALGGTLPIALETLADSVRQGMAKTGETLGGIKDGITQNGEILHLEDDVVEKLFNKEYATQIMDKSTLIKTLVEHGALNITQDYDDVTCDCEEFTLSFIKEAEDKPYKLKVSYNTTDKPDNIIENIAGEYALNAQEISYNTIKERLEKNNLEIEDEEIFDDNTIVLTVNLD